MQFELNQKIKKTFIILILTFSFDSCVSPKFIKEYPRDKDYIKYVFSCNRNMSYLQSKFKSNGVRIIKFIVIQDPPGIIRGLKFVTQDSIPFYVTFNERLVVEFHQIKIMDFQSPLLSSVKINFAYMEYNGILFKINKKLCIKSIINTYDEE